MIDKRETRVLWLTNLPAPYRFPIWSRIAEFTDLKVVFLHGEKNWRKWTVPAGQSWKYDFLSLRSIYVKEYEFIPSIRGVRKLLQNFDVMVLGGWETPFYITAMLIAKKRNIQVIQFYESTVDSQRMQNVVINKIRSKVVSSADFVVTIGTEATKAVEAMGIDSRKIITLFNPVDVSWYHSVAKATSEPKVSGHRYLYVGQLIARKNVESIIRSFATMRNSGDTLTVAGTGPLAESLEKLSTNLEIADCVRFTGHLNQVKLAKLYASNDTLILPSTNEVWGLVVNEALASGMHVIVSDKCGVANFAKGMRGVFICGTEKESIQKAMVETAFRWNGRIQNPDILEYKPERFADEILKIIHNLSKRTDFS